jgi:hypothetical protein
MQKKPSEKQQQIVDFVNKEVEEKGYPSFDVNTINL